MFNKRQEPPKIIPMFLLFRKCDQLIWFRGRRSEIECRSWGGVICTPFFSGTYNR